jgi:hypothetical protein
MKIGHKMMKMRNKAKLAPMTNFSQVYLLDTCGLFERSSFDL